MSETGAGILERLAEVIEKMPSPCTGCRNQALCASQEISCERFHHWVQTGYIGQKPKAPSAKQYRNTFTNSRHDEMFDTLLKRPGHLPMRDLVKHYGFHRVTLARRYLKERSAARDMGPTRYKEWKTNNPRTF